jgi:uncharacterized protein YwqG
MKLMDNRDEITVNQPIIGENKPKLFSKNPNRKEIDVVLNEQITNENVKNEEESFNLNDSNFPQQLKDKYQNKEILIEEDKQSEEKIFKSKVENLNDSLHSHSEIINPPFEELENKVESFQIVFN